MDQSVDEMVSDLKKLGVVPYGQQEKPQKIIKDLSDFWQKKFANDYAKNHHLNGKPEIADYHRQILEYFKMLPASNTEEVFQNTIIQIACAAIQIGKIAEGLEANCIYALRETYAIFDKWLVEANIVEAFKKKSLEEYNETLNKYEGAFQFLTQLKSRDEKVFDLIFLNARPQPFTMIKSYSALMKKMFNSEKSAETEKDLFKNFAEIQEYKRKYPELINRFKDRMITQDKHDFFEMNFVFNGLKWPTKVIAQVILPELNARSKVLRFSQAEVSKLQDFISQTKAAKGSEKNFTI